MATSSITGGDRAPVQSSGRGTDLLGPSDSSDSGSDVQGERGFDAIEEGEIGGNRADLSSDTDAAGTGERGAAVHDTDIVEGADIAPDRIDVIGNPESPEDPRGEGGVGSLAIDTEVEAEDEEDEAETGTGKDAGAGETLR